MFRVPSIVLLVALIAAVVAPLAAAKAGPEFPIGVWRHEFGAGASFGDPTSVCADGPRHTRVCMVAVAVFNSSALGTAASLVTFDAVSGDVRWSRTLVNASSSAPPTASFSGWVTSGVVTVGERPTTMLATATASTLFAFDALGGDQLWAVPLSTACARNIAGVPAHPTFAGGRVVYTIENGVNSSCVTAVFAGNGTTSWSTAASERAVTLIWSLPEPALIAYVAQDVATGVVTIVARDPATGAERWRSHGMQWSPPGLWDNPNLDADSRGGLLFVYAKPHIGLRQVSAIESATGRWLWTVNDTHAESIIDFDTYAYDGDFFRLMTANATTMRLERLNGLTGALVWASEVPTADENSILLVGSGLAAQFGLSSATVTAYAALDGAYAWRQQFKLGTPSTGVLMRASVPLVATRTVTLLGFGLQPCGSFVVVAAALAED